jgi:hypothetical protein
LLKVKSRFFPVFSTDAAGFRLLRISNRFLADVVPDAHIVDHIDGFRPFLSRSIRIQSICQSRVWTAEVVSAETESSKMTFFGGQTTHITEEAARDRIVKNRCLQ